jgi:hypothetical protein
MGQQLPDPRSVLGVKRGMRSMLVTAMGCLKSVRYLLQTLPSTYLSGYHSLAGHGERRVHGNNRPSQQRYQTHSVIHLPPFALVIQAESPGPSASPAVFSARQYPRLRAPAREGQGDWGWGQPGRLGAREVSWKLPRFQLGRDRPLAARHRGIPISHKHVAIMGKRFQNLPHVPEMRA